MVSFKAFFPMIPLHEEIPHVLDSSLYGAYTQVKTSVGSLWEELFLLYSSARKKPCPVQSGNGWETGPRSQQNSVLIPVPALAWRKCL